MALKFKCENCEKELVVKYLIRGETAKCRYCGAETVVPEDALETGAPPTITKVLERRKEERGETREETNPFPLVPFSSGHLRARIAILVVAAGILLTPISVEYTYSQIKLLGEAMEERGATWEQAETYEKRGMTIVALKVITFVPMVVFLLMWVHRAYRNLPSLGVTGLRFKPRKAVSSWFTPFINFYRPFQVIREIWKASDPDVDLSESSS